MERDIRNANQFDFDAIAALDAKVVGGRLNRAEEIDRAIAESRCIVATAGSTIQGFANSKPHGFRGMDFLDLVVVNPSNRRSGIATLLIDHFRKSSKTSECWTSINQSNQPMFSLLRNLGWFESDHVEELDFGDPELFFHTN